jgi:WD40 repeat-containing protein SMU1
MGFVSGGLSQRGDLLYLVGENKILYCVRLETGALEGQATSLTDFEIIGMACHPFANLISVWDEQGSLGLWK